MSDPTAVVFDLDDTLYAERRFALSGYAAVSQHLAVPARRPAPDLFRVLWAAHRQGRRAVALQELMAAMGLPDDMVAAAVQVIRSHPPRVRLPRGTRHVLDELRRRGHRLGILTNGLPATQRGKVAALGVEGLVDAVVYAEEHATGGKPAPACFEAVLTALDVPATRAVFVGDHPRKDVAGARACGLSTVWMVGRQWPEPAEADASAADIRAVPALVERLLESRHVTTG